ncbi:hypothetical protein H0H92_004790 [Tricholoma furcatifolium]|nr:hypothetical protein H0H92_004790 [Tricholoma furcatifolium]
MTTALVKSSRELNPTNSTSVVNLLTVATNTTPKKPNVVAIVSGVIGGLAVLGILVFCLVKGRQKISHVEEGPKSPGLKEVHGGSLPDLKSQFSPDANKNTGKLDRLREALGRRPGIGKKAPLDPILPVYHVSLPRASTDSIDPPPPAVPTHVPRYPSILERGSKRRPPPPLEGYPDLSRNSTVESVQSMDSTISSGDERSGRRRVQPPPTALIVPAAGRPLPGLAAGIKSAGLHIPKSPSRRRSFFSKNPFKHPFIPVRGVDATLRFPPGSPLVPGQYQPSRQHLEARMSEARSPRIEGVMSPRSGSLSARHKQGKQSPSVKRPPPLPEVQEPGSSKQARLVEALQSAGIPVPRTPRTPRTPAQNGSRTALPPQSSKHPLRSARFLPDPPTTSYI